MNDFKFKSNAAAIWRAMGRAAKETVDETVDSIGDEAEAGAPKQTGALAATVVRLHAGKSASAAQNSAESKASKLSPGIEFDARLELYDATSEGHTIGAVQVLADYGAIIHNGGGGRPARPFLEDAGDAGENPFESNARRNFGQELGD